MEALRPFASKEQLELVCSKIDIKDKNLDERFENLQQEVHEIKEQEKYIQELKKIEREVKLEQELDTLLEQIPFSLQDWEDNQNKNSYYLKKKSRARYFILRNVPDHCKYSLFQRLRPSNISGLNIYHTILEHSILKRITRTIKNDIAFCDVLLWVNID